MTSYENDAARGANDILAERHRQLTAEGYTRRHDDAHSVEHLVNAAMAYTTGEQSYWPWNRDEFKPGGLRRDLVKAGALIAAAIDRLDSRGGDAA